MKLFGVSVLKNSPYFKKIVTKAKFEKCTKEKFSLEKYTSILGLVLLMLSLFIVFVKLYYSDVFHRGGRLTF